MAIANIIKEKKARGEEVFDLGVGEIIGVPSPEIADFVRDKLSDPAVWQYPAVAGSRELRQAAADWYNQTYHTAYSPDNVLVTAGGKFALFILLQNLLLPGDEVLIPRPYWVSYPEMVKLFNGAPKFITTAREHDWKISLDDLERSWTPRTKILIINSISNPAGTIYNEAELKDILAWAAAKQVIVIADEVYSDLVFDAGQKFVSCGAIQSAGQVVVVQSCSKNFAMSGWRVGFIFGEPEIIKQAAAIQSQSTTGVAPLCQDAALAAITARASIQTNIKKQLSQRREALFGGLRDYFGLAVKAPAAGLYLFLSLAELGVQNRSCLDFSQELLTASNVAVVPGSAFGVDGYVRLSYGAPVEEINAGLSRLSLFIKSLNEPAAS